MKKLVVLLLTGVVLAGQGQSITDRPGNFSVFPPYREISLFKQPSSLREKPELPEVSAYELLEADPRLIQLVLDEQPQQFFLALPGIGEKSIELELTRVDLLSEDFRIQLSSGTALVESHAGVFYRGKIKGEENSVAAISVFPEGVQAMFSSPASGDHHISKHPSSGESLYMVYADRHLRKAPVFDCYTEDSDRGYHPQELAPQIDLRASGPCVRVFLEVDHDVFLDKGSVSATENYIKGLFNEVAALYAKESITLTLSQLLIWNTASPYSGSDIYGLLQQFQKTRTSINGDAGQLLTYKSSGGIAIVDGLCRSFVSSKLGVSSIDRTYRTLPNYSFSVMVVAHELGHILGSQHTHACVWNGNNTAIDGCPGYVEGSCAVPAAPTGGGTIMSYCHLSSVGINMSNGLGVQPGNLIRNRIAKATCLQVCTTTGSDTTSNKGCDSLILSLILDNYGSETTWQILNAQSQVVASGGPYSDRTLYKAYSFSFCLPYGCYSLVVKDSYGDGMCCSYGNGSFKLSKSSGQVLASGGQFARESYSSFCLQAPDGGSGGGSEPVTCKQVDFTQLLTAPYGGGQDVGKATVLDAGRTLLIENNAWKMIPMDYEITPNTMLAFDFRSTRQGEIHGIGFDSDIYTSSQLTFQLFGNQSWGIQNYKNYDGRGNWKPYVIPVGKHYTGKAKYLFFAADHDISPANGDAYFRYVRIYEGATPCATRLEPEPASEAALSVFPNPASREVRVLVQGLEDDAATIGLYNLLGQQLRHWPVSVVAGQSSLDISVDHLDSGTYLIRLRSGDQTMVQSVVVQK